MSFHEKSSLGTLVLTVICFGVYFSVFFAKYGDPDRGVLIPLFVITTILITVTSVAYHIVIAIWHRRELSTQESDERDQLIEMKATKYSAFVLGFGVMILSWIAIFGALSAFLIGNLLWFMFVFTEVVRLAIQFYFYRRGV